MMSPRSGLLWSSSWHLPSCFCWEAIKYTVPGIHMKHFKVVKELELKVFKP